MDPIELNSDSRWFKVFMWLYAKADERAARYLGNYGHMNICDLPAVAGRIAAYLLSLLVIVCIAGTALGMGAFMYGASFICTMSWVFGNDGYCDPKGVWTPIMFCGSTGLFLFVWSLIWFFTWLRDRKHRKAWEPRKPPGVLALWWRSKRDKICFEIKFVSKKQEKKTE